MNISVIGAGLGGLVASCLLAKAGHQVRVYEKNETPGGKINQAKLGDFRFDTGPSLLTMPFILEDLFSRCGRHINDYVDIQPIEPICRYFYADGQQFDCFQNHNKNLAQIRNFAPHDEEAYNAFLTYAEKLYKRTKHSFLFNPLYNISDLFSINLLDVLRIDAFSTVAGKVDQTFTSRYLKQFFKRFTTYNGSSPYQAPATLNVIPHVELSLGGFYIKGGMYKLVEALIKLATELGVEIKYGREISRILVSNGKASALVTSGGEHIESDSIVCNSDASETYLNLIPENDLPGSKVKKIAKLEPSCSGLVMLLGIDKTYEQLSHHNIFFGADYQKEFRQIFDDKVMPDDPTIYIANTSATDPDHAPDGGSNLFVLINAPYLSDLWDWETHQNDYAKKVIAKLEQHGLTGLQESIQEQEFITPVDFHQKYHSNKGSIYGTSSNSKLAAFLRPKNKSKEIENLYLVGGSTHPGGGIPLVILSAFNAMELIKRYESDK